MAGSGKADGTIPAFSLLGRFLQLYPDFRERLRRRLGSADLADEALSETYLKLQKTVQGPSIGNVRAYLFRTVLNVATDQRRAGARLAEAREIDMALEVADPAPDAARIVAARIEFAALMEAVDALPERRRKILWAARIDGRSCRDIAEALGLSKRTVELELRSALDHCADWVKKRESVDFASDAEETS